MNKTFRRIDPVMHKFPVFLFCAFILFSLQLQAQDREDAGKPVKRFRAGLNFGAYFANRNSANYYNGNEANDNKVSWVMRNYYWYNQDIFTILNANDTVFVYGLPDKMHYKTTVLPGIYFDYALTKNTFLFIEFNYSKLKAQDAITFQVDPKPYLTEKDLRIFPIVGVENRMMIDFGIRRNFQANSKTQVFIQAGFTMNNTRVLSNDFIVRNQAGTFSKTFSIIDIYGSQGYIPGSIPSATYPVYEGGIGFGFHLGGGTSFRFGDGISLEPGLQVQYNNVQLPRYTQMALNAAIYARFIFDKLF